MRFIETELKNVILVEPDVREDQRLEHEQVGVDLPQSAQLGLDLGPAPQPVDAAFHHLAVTLVNGTARERSALVAKSQMRHTSFGIEGGFDFMAV